MTRTRVTNTSTATIRYDHCGQLASRAARLTGDGGFPIGSTVVCTTCQAPRFGHQPA